MSNRQEHLELGVIAGGTVGFIRALLRGGDLTECLGGAVGGALGGAAGALAPDLLEPPTTPRHRGPMHSLALVGGSAMAVPSAEAAWSRFWEEKKANADDATRALLAVLEGLGPGAVAGYASHLALDSGTPAGLPLLGVR